MGIESDKYGAGAGRATDRVVGVVSGPGEASSVSRPTVSSPRRDTLPTLPDGLSLPTFHETEEDVTDVNGRASWFEEAIPSSRTLEKGRLTDSDLGPKTIPAPPLWEVEKS